MAKNKTVFFCKECGFESAKWLGQCPGCKSWDTFTEEPVIKKVNKPAGMKSSREPELIANIKIESENRLASGIGELDRVLGGGIVQGSLVLVGGDPGIGKSTLLLQMCREIIAEGKKVLYISGEESLSQIKMRAERLGLHSGELLLLCETDLELISEAIDRESLILLLLIPFRRCLGKRYRLFPEVSVR